MSAKVGPFALVECLESGSAVQLWRAEQDGQGVVVRLVVEPNDTFAVGRWQAELDALQKLGTKSSLPEILAVFEDEKAYALEWVGDEGLDDRVEKSVSQGEVLSVEEAVEVGLSILDALANLGQVHGALLPRQVRFRPDGRAVLYGIGSKLERVQPRYMAPEMTGEGDIGLHTDQWHIAVSLFELVLGRTLYPGDWSKAFRLALDADNSEALLVLQQNSPVLAKALLPALRHQGASGYASHAEMVMALQNCLVEIESGAPDLPTEASAEPELETMSEVEQPDPADPVAEKANNSFSEDKLESEPSDLEAVPTDRDAVQAQILEAEPEESGLDSESTPAFSEDRSDSAPHESAPEGPPQLERVEIDLQQAVLTEALQPDETEEGALGPLGHGLSLWELEAFSACEGADPVERGSWWIAREGAQTELPEPSLNEDQADAMEQETDEPVALPEPVMRSLDDAVRDLDQEEEEAWPLLEASNLVGSLGSTDDEPEDAEHSEVVAEGGESDESVVPDPVELTSEQIVAPESEFHPTAEEKETASEVQFNAPAEEILEPPVLDELPPIPPPAPPRAKLPPVEELELPGREILTELLEQEQDETTQDSGFDLPWGQPEVVIPAPPQELPVAPSPPGTPDILSPRRPVERGRMDRVEWNQAWRPQPLSERIARGGLLILLGAGIAWAVLG